MTLNIEISGTYRITSDAMQIVVQRKHSIDPTKSPAFNPEKHSPEIRSEWREWKYCGSIEQAIDIICKQKILDSDATQLAQLRDEISSFRRHINGLLGG